MSISKTFRLDERQYNNLLELSQKYNLSQADIINELIKIASSSCISGNRSFRQSFNDRRLGDVMYNLFADDKLL